MLVFRDKYLFVGFATIQFMPILYPIHLCFSFFKQLHLPCPRPFFFLGFLSLKLVKFDHLIVIFFSGIFNSFQHIHKNCIVLFFKLIHLIKDLSKQPSHLNFMLIFVLCLFHPFSDLAFHLENKFFQAVLESFELWVFFIKDIVFPLETLSFGCDDGKPGFFFYGF